MRLKTFLIFVGIAINVFFLYGVSQIKMSVSYCRELVRQDMIAAKQYEESLINDLVKVGQ